MALRADKYLYKVVNWPSDLHAFFTSYKSSVYSISLNFDVNLSISFVQIITNSTVINFTILGQFFFNELEPQIY